MNIKKIIIGIILCAIGQIFSFSQLQLSTKLGWDKKYLWLILLSSIPVTWIYVKSVKFVVDGFNGLLWPSRLLGFGVGIIIFTIMSYLIFKEPFTLKNMICLSLAFLIILTQLLMK